MNLIKKLFSPGAGTAARAVVRAAMICLVAFGFELTSDQMAAVLLLQEALLQLGVQLVPPPQAPPTAP